VRTSTSPSVVQKTLNKNSAFLQNLSEEDKIPVISKINAETREFGVIKLGLPREKIKEDTCIEAIYDKKAAKKKKERDAEIERKQHTGNVRVFGYKHPKVMRFMSLLMRCLKDCMEHKHE